MFKLNNGNIMYEDRGIYTCPFCYIRPITKKEIELLSFVKEYNREYKVMPRLIDMAEYQKTQVSLIHRRIASLERKGYLLHGGKGIWRGIMLTGKF